MDNKEIKILLEKYWEGNTSLEEESIIKDWFKENENSTEFEEESHLFSYFRAQDKIKVGPNFESEILNKIGKKRSINLPLGQSWMNWRAAAVISGIIVATIVLKNPFGSSSLTTDTYDNPQDAYEATRAVLMTISSGMNKGKERTEKLTKFNDAREKLSDIVSETE